MPDETNNPFALDGHVSLVTGGNTGIGLGLAHGLAGAGAAVAIWGRDGERNEQAAAELRAHGQPVEAFVCDVSNENEVAQAFAETVSRLGRVDSCFANAGVGGTRRVSRRCRLTIGGTSRRSTLTASS